MAMICPFDGKDKCQKCQYLDWDEENERIACFLGTDHKKGSSERALMRNAYEACKALIDASPPPSDTNAEEVTDMYDAAERFCKSVEELGYGE